MVILLRKRDLALSALVLCACLGLTAVLWRGRLVPAFAARETGVPLTVVLDAGHGGEDGGAVSPDGVAESQINLAVARKVENLLRFAGQRTAMIRSEDVSVGDPSLGTMRQRKTSDLKNRTAMVEAVENSVLLSIHQNSLPSSPVTHGAQVFWNRQEGADALAEAIQAALNEGINAGNEKLPRQIPDSIYLMKNITAPGVLVECGFLSNAGETGLLQSDAYQLRLAAAISAGFLCGMAERD